ncbi:MAG: acyltransferase family protein [Pirellulales bacterium]
MSTATPSGQRGDRQQGPRVDSSKSSSPSRESKPTSGSSSAARRAMAAESTTSPTAATLPRDRLVSLDAYRGFVMLAMASGGLQLADVAGRFPNSAVARFIEFQGSHVEWAGWAAWDLIQPSFMFMVGVALPYSFASREARGQTRLRGWLHVLWRSLALVMLGIFLRSDGRPMTNFTFEDVLTQIGLGYPFLYLLAGEGWRKLTIAGLALLGILAGYWALFAYWTLPGPDFDWYAVGVDPTTFPLWDGFFAHWNKNANPAAYFDQTFLNWFPRPEGQPFVYNGGGYQTLNFVPSLATMIAGLLTGNLLRSALGKWWKLGIMVAAGAAAIGLGWYAGETICPMVKRIWTPSWAVFSAGCTLLLLSLFYVLIDVAGWRRWSFPLVVVGMNSIATYVMAETGFPSWILRTFRTHLAAITTRHPFDVETNRFAHFWAALCVIAVIWLVDYWMYKKKIFIRI